MSPLYDIINVCKVLILPINIFGLLGVMPALNSMFSRKKAVSIS
jgi:hypothetical protein